MKCSHQVQQTCPHASHEGAHTRLGILGGFYIHPPNSSHAEHASLTLRMKVKSSSITTDLNRSRFIHKILLFLNEFLSLSHAIGWNKLASMYAARLKIAVNGGVAGCHYRLRTSWIMNKPQLVRIFRGWLNVCTY